MKFRNTAQYSIVKTVLQNRVSVSHDDGHCSTDVILFL